MVICPLHSDDNGIDVERSRMDIFNCILIGVIIALAIGLVGFLVALHMRNNASDVTVDENGTIHFIPKKKEVDRIRNGVNKIITLPCGLLSSRKK